MAWVLKPFSPISIYYKMEINRNYLLSKEGFELLNKIFVNAGEGILIANSKGEIKLANDRASKLFGYEVSELENRSVEDLIPSHLRKTHIGHRSSYIKNPTTRPMGSGRDLIGLKKSGDEFPLEISLSHLKHEGEHLVIAFVTDISQRKKQEIALAESRSKLEDYTQKLENKVKERTRELEHLNLGLESQIRERKLAEQALKVSLEEIKKAEKEILKALEKEKELNEMKTRFISMASHEFKTPLTTVLSSANLLSRYTETEQQEKRQRHIDKIKSSVQNLNNILNDFLSLERLESGHIQVRVKEVMLSELLLQINDTFEHTLKKGQKIDFDFKKDLMILSDPHLIQNIVINLVSNAIKYSPDQQPVRVVTESEGDDAIIRVIDRGIGIPEEDQKNLFERFFRAGNASNIGGTGLGLNIVKRYLDLLGGKISFTSKEGEGTEFIIRFPTGIK